jgi:O-antigen/teichoic acid export membrane protein
MKFGMPLVVMNLALLAGNLGTQLIVAHISGESAAGIYAAYYAPIERIVGFATTIAATALLPLMASEWEQGRQREAFQFLLFVIAGTIIIAGGAAGAIVIFGESFVSNFVGPDFATGVTLIAPTALSCFLFGIASILTDVLIIKKQTMRVSLLFALAVTVGLLAAFAVVPQEGALGGVYARLIASASSVLLVGAAATVAVARQESTGEKTGPSTSIDNKV